MEEQGKTKESTIANLICIITFSVACVVLGIIVVVMLFDVNNIKKQLASQGEEIVSLKNANSNEIDVSFNDGYEPGADYHITLNPNTHILTIKEVRGCSLPGDECDSLDLEFVNWVALNQLEYELAKESYKEMATIIEKAASNRSEVSAEEQWQLTLWILAMDGLVDPDNREDIVGNPTMDDWEKIKVQDFNGDGVVTEYEYAIYTLADIANYDLSESAE